MAKSRKASRKNLSPRDSKLLKEVNAAIASAKKSAFKGGSSMRSSTPSSRRSSPSSMRVSKRSKPRSRLATYAKRAAMATILAGFIYLLATGAKDGKCMAYLRTHYDSLRPAAQVAAQGASTEGAPNEASKGFFTNLYQTIISKSPDLTELRSQASTYFHGSLSSITNSINSLIYKRSLNPQQLQLFGPEPTYI